MKNYGSSQLWFWTLIPALFVGAAFLFPVLDKHFDIGDRSLDMAIGLAMVLISPFVWATQFKAEAPAMRRVATQWCKITYGLQVGGIVAAYIVMAATNH